MLKSILVLCGRHIERPAGARPLYELPRFFGIWLGWVVGVGVRRCWFGWVMDWWGALALGGGEYQTWVVDGLFGCGKDLWERWRGTVEKCALQVFFTFSASAKKT